VLTPLPTANGSSPLVSSSCGDLQSRDSTDAEFFLATGRVRGLFGEAGRGIPFDSLPLNFIIIATLFLFLSLRRDVSTFKASSRRATLRPCSHFRRGFGGGGIPCSTESSVLLCVAGNALPSACDGPLGVNTTAGNVTLGYATIGDWVFTEWTAYVSGG